MRPPTFIGGNTESHSELRQRYPRFNEAADFHRRKLIAILPTMLFLFRFNEAADFHRRKPRSRQPTSSWASIRFNEAADFHRRKPDAPPLRGLPEAIMLQ